MIWPVIRVVFGWPLLRALLIWSLPICAAGFGVIIVIRTQQIMPIVSWWFKSTVVFLIGLPITALGLVMVAIGIPFRVEYLETAAQFTDARFAHLGNWMLTRMPRWARWWDNAYDGLLSDKRGWYADWCIEHGIGYPSFWSMWIWAAIRNPANYWSRNITGCDVTSSTVDVLYGPAVVDESNPGLHMLICTDAQGRKYPLVEFYYPWPFKPTYGAYGRFGWKIKLAHARTPPGSREQDCVKGSVYRASLWKDLT